MTMVDARQIGIDELRRLTKKLAEAERRERGEKP